MPESTPKPTPDSKQEASEEDEIARYLEANPDFFSRYPNALEALELPHESGKAISLIERQVSVLRDRNLEMRQRLNGLLESARANDQLFEKTKRLVLTLLEAQDLDGVVEALYNSLDNDYGVEFYSLTFLGKSTEYPVAKAKVVGLDEANQSISTLLRSNRAICGVLRPEELQFLFGNASGQIGSVAAVPLNHGHTFGILAIGNTNPQHYRSSMGTLFLSYIAEVLNRVCPRLMTPHTMK
ncbi:MAG: DUF484 family protein [Porticoccaceae bacterium]